MIRYSSRRTSHQVRKKLFFLLFLTAVVLFFIRNQKPSVISPIPSEITKGPLRQTISFAKDKNPQELRNSIQSTVGNKWKNYSILVKNLNNNFEMGINDTVTYGAASINKIPILSALYYQVQQGSVDLNKQITIQAADIQNYGSGIIRNEEPGSTYTIKTLARLMMQQSDNTAAYVLSVYVVPIADIQMLLPSWGLTQTDMLNNQTSNRDMSILLPKLLDGKIVSQPLTQELKAFLKDSAFEDRLPPLLPKTATVYHKTGDAIATLHDVGVVEDGKLKYYIGIFTSDITDEEETKQLMAKISKLVYDYLKP